MSSLNRVFLMGNLTRDPELKYTPQGTAVCRFSIAVNRKFMQGNEWKTDVQYFQIVVWGKSGENCEKYLAKGRPVFVEGRLQNRSWEKDGIKHTVTEIIAENTQFLGSIGGKNHDRSGSQKSDSASQDEAASPTQGSLPDSGSDEVPF
jgi:single-strand DNA-binding protein